MSKSHRWGKINHGQTFGFLADDFARRLSTIRLGEYERVLLNYVREHSWAKSTHKGGRGSDAIPFTTSITAVAQDIASGIVDEAPFKHIRKKLYEALKTLKRDKILVDVEGHDEAILINTNCQEWQTVTREFLGPGVSLAFSMKAITGTTGEAKSPPEIAPEEDNGVSPGEDTKNVQYPLEGIRRIPPGGYGVSPPGDTDASRLIGTRVSRIQQIPEESVFVGAEPSRSIPDQVRTLILEATKTHDMPRGNEPIAESYAMTASQWVTEGIPPEEILLAFVAALEKEGLKPISMGRFARSFIDNRKADAKQPAQTHGSPPPRASPPQRPRNPTHAERRAEEQKARHAALMEMKARRLSNGNR